RFGFAQEANDLFLGKALLHVQSPRGRELDSKLGRYSKLGGRRNHCKACDELQGDHFVFSPDGPFFPQDQAGVDQLKVIPGHGPLMANASTVQSS
ncbi:hypothetical protein LYZ79_15955, partial [Xanthomonas hortorum pv. vitians]|nr:hypothetical protein [Xanthomonas hortorum pv. vitians]